MVNASNPEEFKAKLEEVLKDEGFVKSLLEMENPEDVQTALAEKDIEVTLEELASARDLLSKYGEKGSELSEDELEEVSGGVITGIIICVCVALGAGLVMGVGAEHMERRGVRR